MYQWNLLFIRFSKIQLKITIEILSKVSVKQLTLDHTSLTDLIAARKSFNGHYQHGFSELYVFMSIIWEKSCHLKGDSLVTG